MNYALATLANTNAYNDLKVFLYTLQLFNKNLPDIYLYCDTYIDIIDLEYKGNIYKKVALDEYDGLTREQMEKTKGKIFKTQWEDFMCEKMNLLEWTQCERVLFCDSDICFMGPLPTISDGCELGLSRHEIRTFDEIRFGLYNGGFVFSGNKDIPKRWREATHTSRYYEQAALEDLTKFFKPYFFPIQNNYGWWRLLQGKESFDKLKDKFSVKNKTIYYEDKQLLSIHTHFKTKDKATTNFNNFILNLLRENNEFIKGLIFST
jgi:hypothetical protein